MKHIGLFFGSFNPIHVGHLIVANSMLELTDMDEVWFVVSPQNPFKERKTLLEDHHRMQMVRVAIDDNYRMRACDAEMHLPVPSYTVVTLAHLAEKYPDKRFSIIMEHTRFAGRAPQRASGRCADDGHLIELHTPANCQRASATLYADRTCVPIPYRDAFLRATVGAPCGRQPSKQASLWLSAKPQTA